MEEPDPGWWDLVQQGEEVAALVRQGEEAGPVMLRAEAELQKKDGGQWAGSKAWHLLDKLWRVVVVAGTDSWLGKDQWQVAGYRMVALPLGVVGQAAQL